MIEIPNSTGKNRYPRGVTLIELVVIIGVAGIALMQASSALSEVKSKSRSLSCQEKMGQIARASLVYASQDANENAIPICIIDAASVSVRYAFYGYGGKGGAGYRTTTDANRSEWGGAGLMDSVHRPLNGVIYKKPFPSPSSQGGPFGHSYDWTEDNRRDLDLYHCPEDAGFPGMHHNGWKQSGLSSYDYYGTSYSANTMFIYDPLDPSNLFSNSIYSRPLSNAPDPDNTILYMENAARFAIFSYNPELNNNLGDCIPQYREEDGFAANGWHGQPWHFNTSFGDGHVANVNIRSYANRTDSVPDVPSCGLNNCRCHCIIVRGDGWQMDTLPAPLVRTSKFRSENGAIQTGSNDGSVTYNIVP